MTLLNPMILYGLGFVLVPVILHFLLRQKPKLLAFPALRLIEQRRRQNVRRFRLRHIWLLLLRMLVIGLIVLALTRPALPAADYSLNLFESLTLGAIVALAVGAYVAMLHLWKRRQMPRHEFNYRRTTLRGWMTGVAILLILLCVGWPYQRRISAEITSPMPTGETDLPVASVFLFDVSLSMGYQQAGQTQLDRARQLAMTHLGDLPPGSPGRRHRQCERQSGSVSHDDAVGTGPAGCADGFSADAGTRRSIAECPAAAAGGPRADSG